MRVLDRVPLLRESRTINFGYRYVRLHRNSLLVWVSVSLVGETNPQRISPAFPAMLDTGNNSDFYLNEHHLNQWAEMSSSLLPTSESRRINQIVIPFHLADVWIHPNKPGSYERCARRPPFRLEVESGIAVSPRTGDNSYSPRLPLLGLSALRYNGLDLWFNSKAGQCTASKSAWGNRLMDLFHRIV